MDSLPTQQALESSSSIDKALLHGYQDAANDAALHDDTHDHLNDQGKAAGEEAVVQLTQTLQKASLSTQARQADILAKIDEMVATGQNYLDQMKAAFTDRMNQLKLEVQGYCFQQAESWAQLSVETHSDQERLRAIQETVSKLNIQVMTPNTLQ